MTPSRLYDIFRENFPERAKKMISYKRVEENAIQLKALNGVSYIFRVESKDSFSFAKVDPNQVGKGRRKRNESN